MLCEMLTGQKAFHRDTAAETMTAILKDEPKALASLNDALSPALDRILRHCLEKDPASRLQSARDLAFDLELIAGLSSSKVEALSTVPRMRRRQILAGLLAGVVTAIAGGVGVAKYLKPSSKNGPIHVSVTTLRSVDAADLQLPLVALAPDGKTVVNMVNRDGKPQLWRRRLDEPEAQRIAGAEEARHAFFSPDGQGLGFFCVIDGQQVPTISVVRRGRGR
jgi:serine/threonine protein kinase